MKHVSRQHDVVDRLMAYRYFLPGSREQRVILAMIKRKRVVIGVGVASALNAAATFSGAGVR
jgi:hypothetical protein